MDAPGRAAPRLVHVATEDWYVRSHGLPMRAQRCAAGFEVHIAAAVTDDDANRGEDVFSSGPLVPVALSAGARLRYLAADALAAAARTIGVAARRPLDERFAADLVGEATVALYRRLLAS